MTTGKPVIVHDSGASAWTLTHADDFARAFCRLLGEPLALGQAVHITSAEAPTWRNILLAVGEALAVVPELVSVASSRLVEFEPAWRGPLLGDKTNAMRFDNSALAGIIGDWTCDISLRDGLDRITPAVRLQLDSGYQPDQRLDALIDRIVATC